MEEIRFEANGLICKIRGEKTLIGAMKKDKFTYHYMIGAREVGTGNADIELVQDDRIRQPVAINYPFAKFQGRLSPRDIIVVGEYLLERARQEKKGLYNISSACASIGDSAVVFYGGATNLGKTSSMLSLVKRAGFEFVSDEKTLLDLEHLEVKGGAISIPTRKRIIKELFFKDVEKTLPEYKEMTLAMGSKKARIMVYPHLDHGLSKPLYYKWKPLDFFWLLTRDFSHEIRGGIRLVNNFSFLLPSLDNKYLTKLRIKRTKNFCERVPCYYFQGSLDQVIEYIPKFMEEENAREK